jgi:DNA-binding NtrC family response regulator
MSSSFRVLIVGGEKEKRDNLSSLACKWELRAVCGSTIAAAAALLHDRLFAMAFCMERLPDGDFRGLVRETSRNTAKLPILDISDRNDWDRYLSVLGGGAFDCVSDSTAPSELEQTFHEALSESRRRGNTVEQVEPLSDGFHDEASPWVET